MSERVDRVHGVYRVRRVESSEFKETEIGLIPKDWEVVRLGEVLIESKETNKDNKKLNVFSISNIYGFIRSDEFFDKQVYSKNLQKYKIVKKGDFAYNPARVNVGSLGLFNHNEEGLVSPMYVVFRIFRSNLLLPEFLFSVLKSDRYLQEIKRISMSRGSVRQILSFKDLCDFQIPLPPLSEQKAIAYVLSTIREAIEKTEQVIKATKELKKSLMKHLFTYGPVSLEDAQKVELKETEIGLIPKDWEVVRLGEVFEIKQGKQLSSKEDKDGKELKPFLRTSNILWNRVDTTNISYMYFSSEEFERLRLKDGDILVCEGGDVGRTAVWEGQIKDCAYQNHIHRLRPINNNIVNYYFSYFMEFAITQSNKFIFDANRTTIPNLSASRLKRFLLPLPPLHIQQQIAEILKTVDDKIQAEENKKKALESLFKSMLNNLMTGRIRVDRVES